MFHKICGIFRQAKIYLLTAIWKPPGGSSTVNIYTQAIYRTTQNKQYMEQQKNFGRELEILSQTPFHGVHEVGITRDAIRRS